MASNPSVLKRQREKDRQERQREKELKRQQRKTEKAARPAGSSDEDPDLAGLVFGPRPPEEY